MAKRIRRLLSPLMDYGSERHCPVCGQSSRAFLAFGHHTIRENAQCPRCGSLERHRLVWLFLSQRTDLFNGAPKKVLHVAPEPCLEARFARKLGKRYVTADITNPRAMIRMDITKIDMPNGTFDVIYCSHVLEHVEDDIGAIRELYRVLKDDGWAILLVPITADSTFEDPAITAPEDRLEHFGHRGHVRNYGKDYPDRLRACGFVVSMTTAADLVSQEDVARFGLGPASGEVYYCTKPHSTP